ncbi:MAG TPA: DNA polymerase III subunit gamma/tau, partial [Candidatus Dormibacteraeota bacterium]|nr:DNA polymerase III subunit gamma/tau [Candidatus Dormibacteraeota bacterium]
MRQTLYLKYRPQRFADLAGQEFIGRALRAAVRDQRTVHAYLFTGIRGTGKTSAARILARALNCERLEDGEPCNVCPACREILDEASMDVVEIDAATNRGVDEIRDLRDAVQFVPAHLRNKVYIIDEAHMLTAAASNALLKTLEEPPDRTYFILATTEPQSLLETVLSRCQRYDFRRAPVPVIVEVLRRVCEAEDVSAEAGVLELVASAAGGSLRDAESLLDRLLGLGERPLTEALTRQALGVTDPAQVSELARACVEGRPADIVRLLGDLYAAGAGPRTLLRSLGEVARQAHAAALGGGGSEPAPAAALGALAPPVVWVALLETCAYGDADLRRADDPQLALEVALLRLAAAQTPVTELGRLAVPVVVPGAGPLADDLAALVQRVARLEAGRPAPAPAPERCSAPARRPRPPDREPDGPPASPDLPGAAVLDPEPGPQPPPLPAGPWADRWAAVMERVRQQSIPVH